MLGSADNVLYGYMPQRILRDDKRKPTIFSLSRDFKELKITKLDEEFDGMNTKFLKFMKIHDKIFLFVTFYNQKLKKEFLLAKSINRQSMLPEGNTIPVATVDYGEDYKGKLVEFNFSISQDTTQILVYSILTDNDENIYKCGFSLLDTNLNLRWKNEDLRFPEKRFYSMLSPAVSNAGDCYILSLVLDSLNETKIQQRNSIQWLKYRRLNDFEKTEYILGILRNKGTEIKQYPFDLPGKQIRTISLGCNDRNEAICAGLTSDKNSFTVTGGCSLILGNSPADELTIHQFSFDEKLVARKVISGNAAIYQEGLRRGKVHSANYYNPLPLVFGDEGSFWFGGEKDRFHYQAVSPKGLIIILNRQELYLFRCNAKGEFLWENKLLKDQQTPLVMGIFGSVKMIGYKNTLHVLYNDIPWNKVNNPIVKEMAVYLATYDHSGHEQIQRLGGYDDLELVFFPALASQYEKNAILLFGSFNAKYRFLKLNLE